MTSGPALALRGLTRRFRDLTAVDLGKACVRELIERTEVDPALIGTVVMGQVIPSVKGRATITPSLNFEYLNKWRAQLAYTNYSGGAGNNLLRDRDFIALNVSFAF